MAAAQHRAEIVKTAMRLFRQQGYASTGLNQILAESGAPKGSLYHYFPGGKEELGVAAVQLAGTLIGDMLSEHANRSASSASFVSAYCNTMAKWMRGSDFRDGCPIATTMLENAPGSSTITEAGREAVNSWVAVISEVFRREGLSRKDADLSARQLICSVQGALVIARVFESVKPILDIGRTFKVAAPAVE